MAMSRNIASLFEHTASQWGLITSAQALRIGVSRTQLNRMASDGRLELVSYGVYRATMGDETSHAAIKAAWLSLYPKRFAYERLHDSPNDAVVTGRTAVCMYGYGDLYESPYCFIVQKGKRSARKDIELVHAPINERDVTREFGLPVATPERAIADLVRLREDPSLIDDVMEDATREGYIFDKERLSELLSPLAKENGYPAGDGESFASGLISFSSGTKRESPSHFNDDIDRIVEYSHMWNWAPDWEVLRDVYLQHSDSYSILTPFAYAYLEELIRSTTTEYGKELLDDSGGQRRRAVGRKLIALSKKENVSNESYLDALSSIEHYFEPGGPLDRGANRNSTLHGFMHSAYWTKDAFEQLIHDIATLSPYGGF